MARVNAKTINTATVRHIYLATMPVLLSANAFYSNHVTASCPLVTSKQKHPVIWWPNP